MATVETPPVEQPAPGPEQPNGRRPLFSKGRRQWRLSGFAIESIVLFLAFLGVYLAVGVYVTIDRHVVVFDGLARLAHAYFVWFNDPPKLAAVGFVWPPIATIAYLPFAAIKPLATSGLALVAYAGVFAAGMLAVLNRIFAVVRMPRLMRWPIIALFGLNPMIVFYGSNGMSEVVYLFLLVVGIYAFIRWYLERESRFLVIAGLAFSLGLLARYEVFTWAAAVTVAVAVAMIRQHVSRSELEGSLLAYLVPITYGVGAWLFINWSVLGDPLFWLRSELPTSATGVPQAQAAALGPLPPHPSLTSIFTNLISLNLDLFLPVLLIGGALVLTFVARRDMMALTLAVFIALNAMFTGLLVWHSGTIGLLQLRYNMRAMPIAVVGMAWLYAVYRRRLARLALWGASVALLVAAVPLTWDTMKTYPYQFEEQAFTRALATGRDQEGAQSVGGYVVGVAPEQRMAAYIKAHVTKKNSILTDDAQAFAVMLYSGRPDLFVDRIDRGDTYWLEVRNYPWGKVQYMLVSRVSLNDLALVFWPGADKGAQPGMKPVFKTSRWALVRLAPKAPPAAGA